MIDKSQEHLNSALSVFGFTEVESAIYTSLMQYPDSTVLELSRRSDIPRSTLYGLLESLENRGYIFSTKKRKSLVYSAASPETLKREFNKRSELFYDAMKFMEYSYHDTTNRPGTALLEGSDGFRKLWKRIFGSGVREYCMITSGVTFLDFIQEKKLIEDIIEERVARNIQSKQLIPDSEKARKIVSRDALEKRESRFLPKGTPIPTTIIIFGNEVAFMTTRRENSVILVMSGETALTFRMVFDLLWNSAIQYN